MIAYMNGWIAAKDRNMCVLEVNGIAYRIEMPAPALANIGTQGEQAKIYTYLQVKDDGLSLFGFAGEDEKFVFEKLIGVSGVGPKLALAALSTYNVSDLLVAIQRGDTAAIARVPGIGKKMAQRIVLELKDGFDGLASSGLSCFEQTIIDADSGDAVYNEALQALLAMGFTAQEADLAMRGYTGDLADVGEVVRYGLKRLGSAL